MSTSPVSSVRLGVLAFAVSCAAAGACQVVEASDIEFNFSKSAQGWTRGNLASTYSAITVASSGPAVWGLFGGSGVLLGEDHSGYAFHFSPNLGGGFGSLFRGTFEVDFRSANPGAAYPFVVLMSSTDFLVKQQDHAASADFVRRSYSLRGDGGWYINSSPYFNGSNAVVATDAQVQAVLADLRYIGISTDIADGSDATWTDNVRLIGVGCAPADINCDGTVNAQDLAALLTGWGTSGASDIDGDGTTGAADLAALLAAWS